MPSAIIRRTALGAGLVLVLLLLAVAALPFIASTQILRDRIALELSVWSGYRVTLGAAPEIDIWPIFKADLADVTFSDWGSEPRQVLHADGIEAELSALAALRGQIVFNNLRVIRPTARIDLTAFRHLSTPSSAGGRLARSVAAARAALDSEAGTPDPASLPSDPFGAIEFVEGRVEIDRGDGQVEAISSLSGRLAWPALNRAARAEATGIWRGELVSLEASTGQPLVLAAGGTAPLSVSLGSALLNMNFSGDASLSGEGYVSGSGQLSSPSLRRMLEWSRTDIAPGAAIGSVSVQSDDISGPPHRLKLAGTTLSIDDNRSTGTLELKLGQPVPLISGTLAFGTMDLSSFLSAFSALTPDRWGRYRTIDTGIGDQIAVDVRLSAETATAGSIAFSNLAATAQIKGPLAAFDISDARAFGGNLQAGMRVDNKADGAEVEIRIRGEGIDMGALATTMQSHYLVPVSRGNLSVTLKGVGGTFQQVLRSASGSISGSFGPGAMAGIDLQKFSERASSGDFFPLSDVGEGPLNFRSVEVKARVTNGNAELEDLQVLTDDAQIALRGVIPLPGRGLALSGRLTGFSKVPISFFVGGSWEAPYISPISMHPDAGR